MMERFKMNPNDPPGKRAINKAVWFSTILRNMAVVIISATIAYCVPDGTFNLTGTLDRGLPGIHLPPTYTSYNVTVDGETTLVHDDLGDMLGTLGSMTIVLPLICVLQQVAIVKSFRES